MKMNLRALRESNPRSYFNHICLIGLIVSVPFVAALYLIGGEKALTWTGIVLSPAVLVNIYWAFFPKKYAEASLKLDYGFVPRAPKGFTLMETLIAIAVLGIIAAMSANAFGRLKDRNSFAGATQDVLSTMRAARADAFGKGTNMVFVVDTMAKKFWLVQDDQATITPDTFDFTKPETGTIPTNVSFAPATHVAFTAPYAGVPVFPACSFCDAHGRGTISFLAGGGALFNGQAAQFVSTAQPGVGHQLVMKDTSPGGTGIVAILVVGETGAISSVSLQ